MGRVEPDAPAVTTIERRARLSETLALAVCLTLPLALWHTGFHVVPADGAKWRGFSDLPGPGHLALSAVIALILALLLARRPPSVRRSFFVLGLAALPVLTVLSGRFEMLLAFQGPLLIPLVAGVLGFALSRTVSGSTALPDRDVGLTMSRWLPVRDSVLLVAAFVFYALVGIRLPGPAGPQGDEPHYLTMAESLLSDCDLDLADEFAHRDYRRFYAGRLEAHTSPASPKGKILPVHAPGLAVLILPAYAVGGYPAVRLFLSLVAALTALLAHRLVRETIGRDDLALLAWAALVFTPPLPFFAVAVYPETPAALCTAAFLLAGRGDLHRGRLALAVGAVGVLPWLHPKFLPLAAAGLVLVLVRRVGIRARVLAILALAVSLALLLGFFHAVYGRASLAAAYGPGVSQDVAFGRIPRGVAALILDRQFGLLPIGPLWVLAVPGAVALLRFRSGDALRAALVGGIVLAVGGSFSMWWGGSCPPARFLIPALPAFALLLAPALPARRGAAGALFAIGLSVVALAVDAPRAIHNRPDGESGLLRLLAPALDLDRFLPSFVGDRSSALPIAATLLAALALGYRFRGRGLAWGAIAHGLVSVALTPGPFLDARRAALGLIDNWDPSRLRVVSGSTDLAALSVPFELRIPAWTVKEGETRQSGRIDLPPGRYRLDVDYRAVDAPPRTWTTRLDLMANDVLVERFYLTQTLRRMSFPWLLPLGARRLAVFARGVQGTVLIESVRVVPVALVPRGRRTDLPWPRQLDEDSYRLGESHVRATPLDRSPRSGNGFLVEDEGERFVVEAPVGSTVIVRISRAAPAERDVLVWGKRPLRLGRQTDLAVSLLAGESDLRAGEVALIPVQVHASGATISFSEGQTSPPTSGASAPSESRSPSPLPHRK